MSDAFIKSRRVVDKNIAALRLKSFDESIAHLSHF